MKKILIMFLLVLFGGFSYFTGLSQEEGGGDPCGCFDDCDLVCEASPMYNCTITYDSGHEILCPFKRKKQTTII